MLGLATLFERTHVNKKTLNIILALAQALIGAIGSVIGNRRRKP